MDLAVRLSRLAVFYSGALNETLMVRRRASAVSNHGMIRASFETPLREDRRILTSS
jgi:hypothetical protein